MKIQLAYRFTGENTEKLVEELKKIKSILEEKGHDIYISALDPNKPDNKKELFLGTINKIKDIDVFLVLVKSEDKSEGMLMEVGHAFGLGKKVIVAINKKVKNTYLRELTDKIIEFRDIDDLYNKLKDLKISKMAEKIVKKVWGSEEWIVNTDKYCGKILNLKKGFRCSMHYHKNKDETFYILDGKVFMEIGDNKKILEQGDSQRIMPGVKHRFTGLENSRIIEFSTGHEESDSYRDTQSEKIDLNKLKDLKI